MRAAGDELVSAERLAALRQAGLTAAPDEAMERFARLVASMLRVPVALGMVLGLCVSMGCSDDDEEEPAVIAGDSGTVTVLGDNMDVPTTAAVRGGNAWVPQGQFDHLPGMMNMAVPPGPFVVSGVSLSNGSAAGSISLPADFYPEGATKAELERWMTSLPEAERARANGFFTTIRRGPNGAFTAVPYSAEYQNEVTRIAALLREAAGISTEPSLKNYLTKRAEAFLSNDYYDSDVAWMELKGPIEPTIGPYEIYEDAAPIEAHIAIAADGQNSRLRSLAGIAVTEWTYPQEALASSFSHSLPHDGVSTEYHKRSGPLTTVPLPGLASSLVYVEEKAEANRLAQLTEKAFAEALELRLHGLLGSITGMGP